MKEDVAIEALRQVKKVLDKYGVEYWLDCGTLLGAVRDGKFIPWDSGIDFGVWYDQAAKVYATFWEFRDKGFKVCFQEEKDSIFILMKDCTSDVGFYQLNNDKATHTWFPHGQMITGQVLDYLHRILLPDVHLPFNDSRMPASITKSLFKIVHVLPFSLRKKFAKSVWILLVKIGCRQINTVIPSHYFKNLSTIKFYGMEFKVPAETERYLEYRYGSDWRTPKKDYVYYKDDGAIEP